MTGIRPASVVAVLAVAVFFGLRPAAAAAASPAGFRCTGTLVVQANVSGAPLNVGGNIALFERGSVYRLDLLSLGFPGADPTTSAVAGALLAPGGATLIYDGTTGQISAYSTGNRVFYQAAPKALPAPVAGSGPPPPQSRAAADPLATLALVARQLRDVEQASIQLTGHSTTNGHPTADIDVSMRRQRPGKAREEYQAQVALADDLDGFPVRIALRSTPATPQDVGGSLRLDLTAISRDTPDDSVFTVPPGLTRVGSIGEVLQAKH